MLLSMGRKGVRDEGEVMVELFILCPVCRNGYTGGFPGDSCLRCHDLKFVLLTPETCPGHEWMIPAIIDELGCITYEEDEQEVPIEVECRYCGVKASKEG